MVTFIWHLGNRVAKQNNRKNFVFRSSGLLHHLFRVNSILCNDMSSS